MIALILEASVFLSVFRPRATCSQSGAQVGRPVAIIECRARASATADGGSILPIGI